MDYSRNKKYHNILSERFWRCIGDMAGYLCIATRILELARWEK
ncbi:hypothetical protein BANRA_05398 [Escherichia coli]|nr:hypothetical protein BANRA_05398 [Escherichia coli]